MTRTAPHHRPISATVVIPVKDDAGPLARCLAALAAQTRPADEIVVVDNGSTDASAAVARAAGATVVHCTEPGIPAASAAGYDAANGEVILRLDADCVPADTWVDAVLRGFAARPDVAVFTGGARFIDGPAALRTPLAVAYLAAYTVVTAPALGHLPLFGSNLAFRRGAWRSIRHAVHRHDAGLHDDLDLAVHVGERHRIRHLAGAEMGMSMRPFASAQSLLRRLARGIRTVVVHWPADFPPVRWERLMFRRMLHRLGVPTPAARHR